MRFGAPFVSLLPQRGLHRQIGSDSLGGDPRSARDGVSAAFTIAYLIAAGN